MSARFSRGSSVLAALILVVLVGGIALAINTVATPRGDLARMSDSQTAEVGSATDRGYGDFNSSAPESCTEAKQAALGKLIGPDVTNTNKGQSGTMDACFGAYSTTGKPSNNPNDYQCTGRAGSANFGDGLVTVKTSVSHIAPAGKCVIAVCQDGKCAGAKSFDGVNMSKYTPNAADPTSALVQNNGTGGEYSAALSEAQSDALKGAFSSSPEDAKNAFDRLDLAQQMSDNNDRIAQLKEFLNSCESGTDCEGVDQSFQEISDLEKQNAALQEQSDKLAESVSHDITQTPDERIASLQAQCDAGNCDARDYQTLQAYKQSQSAAEQYKNLKVQCDAGNCDQNDRNTLAKLQQQINDPKTPLNTGSTFPQGGGQQPGGGPGGGPGSGPGGTGGQPGQQGGGGLGSLGSILQSMLGGLAKALGGGAGGAGGANCTTDQNQYQQQQQQYQQQMTLYNQQLQQYNYQAQIAQMQGYPPPPQPQPPQQPCFNQSSTPVQCTTSPAQPTSGCANGTWKPTTQSNNSCISGWQCVPTGTGGGTTTPPTAQLSCQPQVADVGMTIAISYSCGNATGSAGQGFDTGNALSGSATTTLSNPPAGATKATYGLQCVNGTIPATASCSVDISRPSIILVANPKVVAVNASSTIGWLTTGMKSCVVSSPDMPEFTAQNALNTSVNGMAITPALTETSVFLLHCTTQGGQTKDATTTVQVGAPGGGNGITVSTTADGGSVARGGTMSITWDATASSTNDSAVSLWLYDVDLDEDVGLIARDKTASSTYTWTLPAAGSGCPIDTPYVCGTNLVPGRAYSIDVAIYTPKNAYLGGYPPPNPIQPTYLGYGSSDTFTISQ